MQKPGNQGAARTSLLPVAMFIVGIALVVKTIANGGGAFSVGIILGILFMLAGAGRFYVGRVSR